MSRKGTIILQQYKANLFDLLSEYTFINVHNKTWEDHWVSLVRDVWQTENVGLLLRTENFFSTSPSWKNDEGAVLLVNEVESLFLANDIVGSDDIHNVNELSKFKKVIAIRDEYNVPIGLLCFEEDIQETNGNLFTEIVTEFIAISRGMMNKLFSMRSVIEEEKRYRELFKVTETFHSSMEIDTLLGEIISTLQKVFPLYSYHLLLSNDHQEYRNLPIQNFDYDHASTAAMHTFVSGEIQVERSTVSGNTTLYAPLKGKQGIYGVMQVGSLTQKIFPQKEKEFIKLLAYTAGSALENAKLYQQSKRLISDLQLINELSHRLNSNLRLSETLTFLNAQIQKSFHASAIGFVFLQDRIERYNVLPGSSEVFRNGNGVEYIQYVESKILRDNDSLFIGDLNGKFDHMDPLYRSIMAVPMVEHSEIIGFCLVLHYEPYSFSFDMYKLLQSFIHHSTLALTNSMLREKLEKMVITDHLTQLYSRNHLDEFIERSMIEETQGALLLFDIDDFKKINDTYGHHIGDQVLIQVANLLKEIVKGLGLSARWGGEEMAVYFPRTTTADVFHIAEKIVEECPIRTKPNVTLSCGLSDWSRDKTITATKLLTEADGALYEAKKKGKNQVVVQK
ncbi:sensor domain-containing diguanylate cyclase [Bacillus sp. 2205SS5-2]|uniref:sensor domain-containing diguanylate cyclase n=1 Tax=Bacillus sp. 2205SS5-2 TaxID=3109031 RepID=UPI003006DEC0